MKKLNGIAFIATWFVISAHAANDEILDPFGPVSKEQREMLEKREPITELGRHRSYYLAGSEELGDNEMRIIALGTGVPQVQRGQLSACWLIELGNGDSFIFDIGTRCTVNLSFLEMPWDKFSKVFLSHLHADHIGDLPTLLADGWDMGRSVPLEVWGPNGATPEMGTRAAIEHMLGMYRWDFGSKLGRGAMSAYAVKIHEFDFSKEQVVYEKNGVTIRSWPALHTIDGPVSYSLEWNGLKVSYSGDMVPNKWFVDNSHDSDLVILECADPVEVLIEDRGYPPEAAWMIATTAHLQARQAAEMFSMLEPRLAVCHSYVDNGIDAKQKRYETVKRHYSGDVSIAQDMMVWNVTPDDIIIRKVVGGDFGHTFLIPRSSEAPDRSKLMETSNWLKEGRLKMPEIYQEVLDNLKPEYRERILQNVAEEHLP